MTDAMRAAAVLALASAAAVVVVAACDTERAPLDRQLPPRAGSAMDVRTSELQAGPERRRAPVRNPFEGNVHAITEGKRLYAWMNCAGCHGAIGGGSIGPPLSDADWIYGDAPENVYQSIVQGRPNGMPAFRDRLSDEALWKLVAFVRSMGGTPAKEEEGAVAAEPERARESQPQHDREDVSR